MRLNWFITVSDEFGTLRTIHPLALGTDKNRIEDILYKFLIPDPAPVPVQTSTPAPKALKAPAPASVARSQGYTGDECTNCHSMRLKVSGHCLVCEDCGETTGCS